MRNGKCEMRNGGQLHGMRLVQLGVEMVMEGGNSSAPNYYYYYYQPAMEMALRNEKGPKELRV